MTLLERNEHALCVAIDDTELANLSKLVEIDFPHYELHRVIVNHYPGSGTGRSNVTRTHEYGLFLVPKDVDIVRGKAKSDGKRERNFRRSGTGENNYRTGRPNSFYAVVVNRRPIRSFVSEEPPRLGSSYPKETTEEGYIRIYPIGKDGSERVWTLSYERAKLALKQGTLLCTQNLSINRIYEDKNSRSLLKSVWLDKKYNAVTNGTNLLKDLFSVSNLFSYPKSIFTVQTSIDAIIYENDEAIVLDYFAGSGTTGHAVINLNREDGGQRKYILVEMGHHFDTVLLPRIKKVIYSPDWKDGKPVSRNGVTQLFKYIRLESYEDTMDSLEVTPPSDAQQALLAENTALAEDYRLRYALGVETAGSACLLSKAFADPFTYTLSVGARWCAPRSSG